jgi:Tol biopolymer transport system component
MKEQFSKDGVTYTVQKVPSGKYKIFVTDATHKTPTDATTVSGGGEIWKEYNTDGEAYNVIRDIISSFLPPGD